MMNWDNVKEFVYIGVKRETNDNIAVTGNYQDLTTYFFIATGNAIIQVTHQMIDNMKISEQELFDAAIENTARETRIRPIIDVISDFGLEVDNDNVIPDKMPLVITNRANYLGAGAIACNNVMNRVCDLLHTSMIWIIPSSIHELLAIKANTYDERDNISKMITEVNDTQVSPNERLADHPYLFVKGDGISLA